VGASTWTAVNPCNTSYTAGAPVFFGSVANATTGAVASNLSILRAYAMGNDWVNAGIGSKPGQPGAAPNVTATNTTCAANVATTTVPAETTTATLGIVSIQGKPQVRYAPAAGTTSEIIMVRSVSPTYEFVPATGAVATVKRRNIVDINKCNTCHEGSMYQHGGNRVDSIDLCEMCHNPAANEKDVRVDTYNVTAAEAYDKKVGETYDLRNMVHSIHSAGETGQPLVYYRTNGIYFFGSKAALAATTNWPTTDIVGDAVGCRLVFGAGPTADGGVPAGLSGCTTPGAQKHNFVEVHYPRSLADCTACHTPGTVSSPPNPRMAVGVTLDPGAAPWNVLTDDVVIGPSAISCMSCHQSGDPLQQFYKRSHAFSFGFAPSAFAGLSRQALLDAAATPGSGGPTEQCAVCHQDLENKHATRGIRSVSEVALQPF
jgi:OmcA/MtrC family decaheme c-type cytochrome